MGQKDKLIQRLKTMPKDFTFEEAEKLLGYLSFEKSNKGKTSGSRIMFSSKKYTTKILLYKPHPQKELKESQGKQLIEQLEQEGLL
ncbi:MAG: type II toxin-antitoxin system HicA family toxin [Lachnospiraceae bacterium]|nr:type II toxin-antitoxin system HicA family toxin [Lachnospiraceae bacterium]